MEKQKRYSKRRAALEGLTREIKEGKGRLLEELAE